MMTETMSLLVISCLFLTSPPPIIAGSDNAGAARQIDSYGSGNTIVTQSLTAEEVVVQSDSPSSTGGNDGGGPAVVVSAGQPQTIPVEGSYICDGQDAQGNNSGACRFQPAPAAPALAPAPAPIVLSSRDVATLIVEGSGITFQPPGDTILLHMPLIAHTNPATRTLSTTVGPTRVDIEATPATYTWNWGDGTTATTTDPGHPYPHQTVTHLYATTANNVTVTLTTTWTARFRPTGATTWKPVDGYITTTQAAPPFNIRRLVPYLSDDAEEHHNH